MTPFNSLNTKASPRAYNICDRDVAYALIALSS